MFTTNGLAEILNVHRQTILYAYRTNKTLIPSFQFTKDGVGEYDEGRIGPQVHPLFTIDDVERWMESGRVRGETRRKWREWKNEDT